MTSVKIQHHFLHLSLPAPYPAHAKQWSPVATYGILLQLSYAHFTAQHCPLQFSQQQHSTWHHWSWCKDGLSKSERGRLA